MRPPEPEERVSPAHSLPARFSPCSQAHSLLLTLTQIDPLIPLPYMSNSVLTSTSSWLGTLASPPDPSLNSKFSTIALGNSHGSRRSRGGLGFFQDGEEHEQSSRPSLADQDDLQSLGREVEAGWSITFAEGPKSRSRSRKVCIRL